MIRVQDVLHLTDKSVVNKSEACKVFLKTMKKLGNESMKFMIIHNLVLNMESTLKWLTLSGLCCFMPYKPRLLEGLLFKSIRISQALGNPDFIFLMFIYFWERERKSESECTSRGGAEREGHGGSKAGSALTAQSPLRAQTHEPWDHDLSRSRTLNRLSHPGAPRFHFEM